MSYKMKKAIRRASEALYGHQKFMGFGYVVVRQPAGGAWGVFPRVPAGLLAATVDGMKDLWWSSTVWLLLT